MILERHEIEPGSLGQLRERDDVLCRWFRGVMKVPKARSCP
jgi:hypothetical protein